MYRIYTMFERKITEKNKNLKNPDTFDNGVGDVGYDIVY